MLLSGKAFFRWTGGQPPGDAPNFPLSLRDAGYLTYHHGKRGNTPLNIQAKFEINKYVTNDQAERQRGEPGQEIVDAAVTAFQYSSWCAVPSGVTLSSTMSFWKR